MLTYNCDAIIAALNKHLAEQDKLDNSEQMEAMINDLLEDDCKAIIDRMLNDDACGVKFGGQEFDTVNGFDVIARFAIATILASDESSMQPANKIIRTALADAAERIARNECN